MTKLFTRDHEWLVIDGNIATVGITDFAQSQLGDVVFVTLPNEGDHIASGAGVAVVESVKAASDVYAPVTGKVVEANSAIVDDPSLVNSAPEGDGWFFKVELENLAELEGMLDADAYQAISG